MKEINKPLNNILSIIEEDKKISNPVKSAFVLETFIDNGYLLYNTLTQEILFLDNSEYESMYSNEYLIKHCFLIDPAIDEIKRVDELREILKIAKSNDNITSYTIFTTTDCNARCYYCFELKCAKKRMSEITANKVADYIIKKSNGSECHLKWFGGEPLFNYNVINIITKRLQEANVPYYSTMTSNGYLFDDEINSHLKDWNLKEVQITLDGTEENYNRIKAYIGKPTFSPFEKVINNIETLSNMEVSIDIRLNISMENYIDIKKLILYLNNRFKNNTNIHIYTAILFQELENETNHKFLKEQEKEIKALLIDNLKIKEESLNKIKLNFCQVDSGQSVTILPDGKLGLCEHFTDSNFIGDVNNGIIDPHAVKHLREYEQKLSKCSHCFNYPFCLRLKICNRHIDCSDENLNLIKDNLIKKAINIYKRK